VCVGPPEELRRRSLYRRARPRAALAASAGIGSDTQKPLAIVIIGGLVSATVLTLFMLPVLYALVARPVLSTEAELAAASL